MRVFKLFIIISRFISLFLVVFSNVFFPTSVVHISSLPLDNSMDIIEGGGVYTNSLNSYIN
jgi:hypothetical protein